MKLSTLTAILTLVVAAGGCGEGGGRRGNETARAQPPADSSRSGGGVRGIPAAELEAAAGDVVAFLRGAGPFERVRLADTVTLYVSPEGGGARAVFDRERLRSSSSWIVRSERQRYAFAPPVGLTKLTTRVGRHFDCLEYPLSSRFPALAPLPHVGVKLEPDSGGNCLQSWNVTLVFDSVARPPRLVAAVYDQWEW